MVRTRVGYAGGTKKDPTYRSLGDHTETLQIDYDPSVISFEGLLDIFWKSHDPTSRPWSRQYRSIILYHNEEQKRLAMESRDRQAVLQKKPITTEILPFSAFYLAEDYHQKYRLQQEEEIMREFESMYPICKGVTDSTAAARVNGFLGGYGSPDDLKKEIGLLGLSEQGKKRLIQILSSGRPAFRACPLK